MLAVHNNGMKAVERKRRIILSAVALIVAVVGVFSSGTIRVPTQQPAAPAVQLAVASPVGEVLQSLAVKGRAPKTDYSRDQFGSGWTTTSGCDTRNVILYRDMPGSIVNDSCHVTKGTLLDPYTGQTITFVRGSQTSSDVQIDHVVALSNAWQTGAQQLTPQIRIDLANDPLELLAVDGPANQEKSDGDAATWLPPNKAFRCQYVARQIAVKQKYNLWVTQPERDAIARVLQQCPDQTLPKA